MIKEIHDAGARTMLQENGDVAGAFMALQHGHNVDALFGTGGSPEGVITAIFARALGGEFFGRVDPRGDDEAKVVKDFGLDAGTWLSGARSEEHTSELQSLMRISYAVFCLKKKNRLTQ